MRFRKFILLEDAPPMGMTPPADPIGGQPMGAAPPMGDPMGGPPPGMGAPPPPMGGGMGANPEPQPVPQHADVWDVLDALLTHQPIKQEEQLKKYKSQKAQLSAQNSPPPPPGGPPGGPLGDSSGALLS